MHVELGSFTGDLWPIGGVIVAVLLVAAWQRTHRPVYVAGCAAFGIYLLFAIDRVFFPIRQNEGYPARFLESINLIPLNFDFSELPNLVLMQLAQNVLLTVPFGFGAGLLMRVSTKQALGLALAVGFGIEVIQLIIGLLLGYAYRVIDVNDALLNGLGVLLGYAGFRATAWLYRALQSRFA